jgi:FecR protein
MKQERKAISRRLAGFLGVAALVWGVLMAAPSLRADGESDADSSKAARAVRLSYVEGEVHLYQDGQTLADRALANTPLFEGARVDTGNDGRAEIQFEDGSVARISPQSSLSLTVLQGLSANAERSAEMVLNSGLAYFELQGDSDSNHTRVRFDGAEVTASGSTVFRLNLDKSPGEVAVFSGDAHLEGSSVPTLDLHGGESVALNGTDPNSYNLAETIEPDSWDTWNSDREQDLTTASADRTEATQSQPDEQNPAWSELDANGNWYNVPDNGYVWSPNEASNPDWDPYGNGYWMNSPNYGYMWISGYQWGYLPYQCGAWNFYPSFGWGWAPGGYCNPWWGGGGGWVINIGYAPPHYRCPAPPHTRHPGTMDRGQAPQPLIAVNRHGATPGNTFHSPRDRTGTVLIAGKAVNPLRPVQQTRFPYHSGPVVSPRHGANQPRLSATPRPVNEGGNSYPRAVGVPARPGTIYGTAPSQPRPGSTYTPPATQPRNGTTYRPPAATQPGYFSHPAPPVHTAPPPVHTAPPPAPIRSAPPPSAPSHPMGGGGGHPSGGGAAHPTGASPR